MLINYLLRIEMIELISNYRLFIVIVVSMQIFTSCGTIINGPTQEISVITHPAGAEVIVNGKTSHITPVKIQLPRKSNHQLVISKEGFKPQMVKLKRTLSGVVIGYLLPGGLIFMGVDAVNGAQFTLQPETLNLALQPLIEGNTALAAHFQGRKPIKRLLKPPIKPRV